MKRPKKRLLFAGLIAAALLSISGGILWYRHASSQPNAYRRDAAKVQSALTFPIWDFRPVTNTTFRYVSGSMNASQNILTFQVRDVKNRRVSITLQERPSELDIEKIDGRVQLNVPAGRGAIGRNEVDTNGAIYGDSTMLFISSQTRYDDESVKALLNSFFNL